MTCIAVGSLLNFIGLEIQKRQIEKCFKKREKLLINYQHNLHFIHANIISKKGSFKEFLQEFPKRNGSIQSISILNPDPCFKRRQIKRRMINETVLNYLSDGVEKDTRTQGIEERGQGIKENSQSRQ